MAWGGCVGVWQISRQFPKKSSNNGFVLKKINFLLIKELLLECLWGRLMWVDVAQNICDGHRTTVWGQVSFYLSVDSGEQSRLPALWGKYLSTLDNLSSLLCVCNVCVCGRALLCTPDWPWTCSSIPALTFRVLKWGASWLTHGVMGNRRTAADFKGFKFRIVGAMICSAHILISVQQEDRVTAGNKWVPDPLLHLPLPMSSI